MSNSEKILKLMKRAGFNEINELYEAFNKYNYRRDIKIKSYFQIYQQIMNYNIKPEYVVKMSRLLKCSPRLIRPDIFYD